MGLKSIFREGMKEQRRKKSLRKEKNDLQKKQEIYGRQLTALGQKAWEAKINVAAYADLQSLLTAAQKQLDDLRVQAEKLQQQKQAAEAERKQESERFVAGQKEIEAKKKIVDGNLQEQKDALSAIQREAAQATGRLQAIAAERTQLETKMAATTTPDNEKAAGQNKLAGLAKEEGELKIKIREKEETGKVTSAKITPLQEESSRLQKQIDNIKAEQKQVLGDRDKKISALDLEINGSNSKLKETEKTQGANYRQLGEKMAADGTCDEKINPELAAVKTTQNEMENIGRGIGDLEGQKDAAAVSAYKKMTAIIIAGVVLIAAIIILLFMLLSAKDKGTPLSRLLDQTGTDATGLQEFAQQMEKGIGGLTAESEKIQGKKIIAVAESTLKAVLPSMAGWQMENPSYSRGAVGELETAYLQGDYTGPESQKIHVNITDAGGASALLAPVKMLFAMKITVDNEETYQKVSVYNDIPVAERYDKGSQEASFGIIAKDRYLIELKTKAENGLELLKEFMDKLDLSQLVP
ncbi:MAG: hypothetical protein WCL37_01865 [Chrysiogenales bacterium]